MIEPRPLASPAIQAQRALNRRANSCMFADADDDRRLLPVVAARESARRRDTVSMRPLSKRERGAFLVEFGWLRQQLAGE